MNRLHKTVHVRRLGKRSGPLFALSLVALAMTGCGIEPETLQKLQQAAEQVSGSRPMGKDPAAVVKPDVRSYQPLYPDRHDPFSFPSSTVDIAEAGPTSPDVTRQFRVLGFAEVDQPRVLMQVEGEVFSLQMGEFVGGMEIVEVRPPAVRLRSGDLTWTATMFDRQAD